MLFVAVLGTVEARREGEPLPVPAGKSTELLARLAVDPGVPVRVDALVEDLWGRPTGRNTLQSKVSQLRRALGDKDLVRAVGDAYVLAVEPHDVDALRVGQLAAAARTAREAGDHAEALESAEAGLALFRGEVLPEAGPWAAPHRTALDETRWTLIELAMSSRVDLGAGGELVADLERLVQEQPLREQLWVALITALYRAGRQADALDSYRRVRRHLIDELGVDPGPELQELEARVLEQSPELGGARRSDPLIRPGNVAPAAAPLVGRADEVEAVIAVLAEQRLVTLAGSAGVGKTRLATELAGLHEAPGGSWMVRLDALESDSDSTPVAPHVIAQSIAETMHVSGGTPGLLDRLRGARTLLFLDNCEHVIAPVAATVRSLLDQVPGLQVLATSQVALGLEDEHVHPVRPLPLEQSVALFAQRAQRLRGDFVVDADNLASVEDVCRALDGLPLAIELAAARVRSLPVPEIARRLDDRFGLLRDPSSHDPERRRALEAALGWSYELLFPDDQRGLWALSCFADGATLGAFEHVLRALGAPERSELDTITRLVDRSLVRLDDTVEHEPRYRLLDSVRAFGSARLAESGETDTALAAHAEWYAERAQWCDQHIRSDRQPECLAFVRAERGDVDSALTWSRDNRADLAQVIALGLAWTWAVLGDGTSGAERLRNAVGPATPARARATAGLVTVWLEASAGNLVVAQADLDAAAESAMEVGEAWLLADVERHRAFLAIQQGRPQGVLEATAAALATYRSQPLGWEGATALLLSAYGSLMVGAVGEAREAATEAASVLTPLGDSWAEVHLQGILAGVAHGEARFADAAQAFDNAAEAARRLGFLGQTALHRVSYARVLAELEDPNAGSAFEQAAAEAAAVGDGRLSASIRYHLATLARAEGDRDRAIALLQENVRWYADAGGGDHDEAGRRELAELLGS